MARQFSIHVLARHGTELDRESVVEMAITTPTIIDPLFRRISFTGVILGGADADTREKFLRTLQRDSDLEATNLFFNAFHYGDATFTADGFLPPTPKSFQHAVAHILRHLENPDQYGSILDVEAWTLLSILEVTGKRSFADLATLNRLRALLSSDSRLNAQLTPSLRRQFQRQFSRLLRGVS